MLFNQLSSILLGSILLQSPYVFVGFTIPPYCESIPQDYSV